MPQSEMVRVTAKGSLKRGGIAEKPSKSAAKTSINDEELAAAALASLTYGCFPDNGTALPRSGQVIASLEPAQELTTDPFYTDFSVINESDLAILAHFEEDPSLHGALNTCPPVIRHVWEQQLSKLKHVLDDLGPARKNSGGVLQPFPEKVSPLYSSSLSMQCTV